MKNWIFLSLVTLSLWSSAQEPLRVFGHAKDAISGEPLAYAHVGILNTALGTVTNMQGEFQLYIPVDYLHSDLTISYIGYQKFALPIHSIKAEQSLVVELRPTATYLRDLIISAKQKSIIEEAVDAIPENHDQSKMKLRGFFRAQVTNSKQTIQVSETAFDIYRHGEAGEEQSDLKVLKGRISRDSASFKDIANLGIGVTPGGLYNLSFLREHSLFTKKSLKRHEFEIVDVTTYDDRPVFVVNFDLIKPSKDKGFKGQILLDTESLAFVRIRFDLSPKIQEPVPLFEDAKLIGWVIGMSESAWTKQFEELNFQLVNGSWYLSHVKFDIALTMERPNKDVKELLTYKADFVVTDISKADFILPSKEELAKNRHLEAQPSFGKGDFWANYNYLIPDEGFDQHFEEILERNKQQKK